MVVWVIKNVIQVHTFQHPLKLLVLHVYHSRNFLLTRYDTSWYFMRWMCLIKMMLHVISPYTFGTHRSMSQIICTWLGSGGLHRCSAQWPKIRTQTFWFIEFLTTFLVSILQVSITRLTTPSTSIRTNIFQENMLSNMCPHHILSACFLADFAFPFGIGSFLLSFSSINWCFLLFLCWLTNASIFHGQLYLKINDEISKSEAQII